MAAGKVVVYADGKMTKTATGQNATVDGHLVVSGNLTVSGDTITANVGTVNVEDKNMTLNYLDGDSSATADGAGITIQDAVDATTDATMLWNATNDEFDFSHGINLASGELYKINGNQIASTDLADVTTFAASLLDDGDAATARTTLGVDAAGTDNSVDVDLDTLVEGLFTMNGQTIEPDSSLTGDLVITWNDTTGLTGYNSATFQSTFGLEIGTDVQAQSDILDDLSGLTQAANKVPYFSSNTAAGTLDFHDDDNLSQDSATAVASQQSIKAYVDAQIGGAALTGGSNISINGSSIDLDNNISLAQGGSIEADVIVANQVVASNIVSVNLDVGESIALGLAVAITSDGTVQKADNTSSSKDMLVGIVIDDGAQDINGNVGDDRATVGYTVAVDSYANGGKGIPVAIAGSITVANISGAKNAGDELYLVTGGQLSASAPSAGAVVRAGYVVDASTNKVLVQPQFIMDN